MNKKIKRSQINQEYIIIILTGLVNASVFNTKRRVQILFMVTMKVYAQIIRVMTLKRWKPKKWHPYTSMHRHSNTRRPDPVWSSKTRALWTNPVATVHEQPTDAKRIAREKQRRKSKAAAEEQEVVEEEEEEEEEEEDGKSNSRRHRRSQSDKSIDNNIPKTTSQMK